ncbi:MAG: HEPN domain-containing protein [Candidatus Asgardarchaeia archaeon]
MKKAENDLINAKNSINIKPKPPLDTVCFHAQQCAEKYLKAFLTFHEIEFEKTHDISDLLLLASKVDEGFVRLLEEGKLLTPYAVEVRYPVLFEEPTFEEAKKAIEIAEKIREFVLERLPTRVKNK